MLRPRAALPFVLFAPVICACGADALPCGSATCEGGPEYCQIDEDAEGNETAECRESFDPDACQEEPSCGVCVPPNDSCGCSCATVEGGIVFRCVPVDESVPCGG